MEFWSAFYQESLQEPWWVNPHAPSPEKARESLPQVPYLLISHQPLSEYAQEMVGKMIAALGWKEGRDVSVLVQSEPLWNSLIGASRKYSLLLFGGQPAIGLGVYENWQGHQLMSTHGLSNLVEYPALKGETWQHLKDFAGIKKP